MSVWIPLVSAGSCNSCPPLSQKAGLPGTPPAFVMHFPLWRTHGKSIMGSGTQPKSLAPGRHGAQGTWRVSSEVCNSSSNWCCFKGQMDLIKCFHFKRLEHFIQHFPADNFSFFENFPFQENVFNFSFQSQFRMKLNIQVSECNAIWTSGLGNSLIN